MNARAINADALPGTRDTLARNASRTAGDADDPNFELGEYAVEDAPTFRDLAMQTVRTGKRYVQAHPWKSVGVAFGAGLLLSAVAKRGVLRVAMLIAAEKLTQVVAGAFKGRAQAND